MITLITIFCEPSHLKVLGCVVWDENKVDILKEELRQ